MRRQPAEPGHRPRAGSRFAAGRCRSCGESYVLDRQTQPWARARTCSEVCAKRLANSRRKPVTCAHCVMVEDYQMERLRQEIAVENGGFRDERWRSSIITFRTWLRHYPWEREPDGTDPR